MTANVKYTVEQRTLLRNSHCLSVDSDSIYLQLKPTIWSLSYPHKHTNCTIPRFKPTPLRHAEKQQVYWNWATLLCRVLHFNRQNLMLITPP